MDAGEVLAGAAGIALFAGTGLGVAELAPGLRALPLARRAGYAYPLGVAWIAGGLYALSHELAVPLGRAAVVALAAAPIAGGLAARVFRPPPRRDAEAVRPRPRLRVLQAAAVAIAALISLAVLCEALANPIRDWDGRMTWAAQARYVRAAGTVDAPVLRDARWYVTHPRYPLLLPLAQVAVADLTGSGERASTFRALYAGFFPAFLLLVYDGARRWAGRPAAALAVLAAALVPFPAFSPEGGAGTAYSDLPLACFYGAGLLLLLRVPPGGRARVGHGLAAGLLLAAAALAKQEGVLLALWAVAVAPLALAGHLGSTRGRRRLLRRLAPIGLAGLVLAAGLALLVSWSAAIPERYDENYRSLVSLGALWPAMITRAPLVLSVVRAKMLSFENWTILWWVAPLVLLLGRRGLRRRVALPLALAAAAPLAIAWVAYTLDTEPIPLVSTTWNRFLLQAAIPGFLLLSLSLRSLLRGGRASRPGVTGSA